MFYKVKPKISKMATSKVKIQSVNLTLSYSAITTWGNIEGDFKRELLGGSFLIV